MENWFVAFECADPRLLDSLAGAPPVLRPMHVHDLHLTVAFLGQVGAARAEAAWASSVDATWSALPLRFGTLGWLGHPHRPSALVLHPCPGPDSDRVAARMVEWGSRWLTAAGLPAEARRAVPHVTIARLPRQAASATVAEARAWSARATVPSVEIALHTLSLYRSSPADGRRYATVARVVARRSATGPA